MGAVTNRVDPGLTPFGVWLEAACAARGWKTSRAAREAKLNPSSVYRNVHGSRAPGLETVAALCDVLELSPRDAAEGYRLAGLPVPRPSAAPATAPELAAQGDDAKAGVSDRIGGIYRRLAALGPEPQGAALEEAVEHRATLALLWRQLGFVDHAAEEQARVDGLIARRSTRVA